MREIKFRMWDKETKAMYLQEQFAIAGNGLIVFAFDDTRLEKNTNGFSGYEHVKRKNSKKVELMQFTGLFDRNGKEIYEGDIMKDAWSDEVGEVAFNDGAFDPGFGYRDSWDLQMQSGKVIGDIYTTPELLTSN